MTNEYLDMTHPGRKMSGLSIKDTNNILYI